ncbi:MAG: GNAT family N-acetyltransferase [bacterium]
MLCCPTELSPSHADRLIDLHMAAFPGFFLTSLGPRFLRLLYQGFATMPSGVCILAEEDGRLIGVAAGTTQPDLFFKQLLRTNGPRFALATIPGLLRNPLFVARKCLGALFYRGESLPDLPNAALLSSLAVAPEHSSKGIGRALVQAFAVEARSHGCSSIYLTTDAVGNDQVNRFYEKCGFTLRDTIKRPGNRVLNRWVLEIGGIADRRLSTADCTLRLVLRRARLKTEAGGMRQGLQRDTQYIHVGQYLVAFDDRPDLSAVEEAKSNGPGERC